ncbi:CRISPR-associated (Cas) DxTHG family [Campylobacter geochelonis]|nr:TM1812 family CRISPR-associated protein [Campylobacter geochelonis]CZE46274.1 CRISPR-associated (Cas) DxTHG family [Campylobacter geochelonis]CZE50708.1 CRISPR-associated (Cas) DxTHG family [Campylobacter geochelonis]
MKLIATLGSTPLKDKPFSYQIENEIYKEFLAFKAVQRHYEILDKDVTIFGTKETLSKLGNEIKHHKFENIDDIQKSEGFSDNQLAFYMFEHIFNDKEDDFILDITQGFRHYPISIFSSILLSKNYNPQAIYYAKTTDENAQEFKFIDLLETIYSSNLIILINTFIKTGGVPEFGKTNGDMDKLYPFLKKLGNELSLNQYLTAINSAKHIEKIIDSLRDKFKFLDKNFNELTKDLKQISSLENKSEYIQLIEFAQFALDKNLLVQAMQFLIEAILAYLDQKLQEKYPNTLVGVKKLNITKNTRKTSQDIYKIRSAIKSDILYKKTINKQKYQAIFGTNLLNLLINLRDIDIKRNDISHPNFKNTGISASLVYKYISDFKKMVL